MELALTFKKSTIGLLLFGFLVTAQSLFPRTIFFISAIVVLGILFGLADYHFPLKIVSYQTLLIGLFFLGLFGTLFPLGNYQTTDLIRDMVYFLSPVLFILIGRYLSILQVSFEKIIQWVIILSAILSLYFIGHLIWVLLQLNVTNIYNLRNQIGHGYTIVPFGLTLLIFTSVIKNKFWRVVLSLLMLSHLILSFSRSLMIITMILVLVLAMEKKASRKLISVSLIILLAAVIFKIFEEQTFIANFLTKIMRTITELSGSQDWSSSQMITSNWRGYETHQAMTEFNSWNIFHQLFGGGFGNNIYVGDYAYLVGVKGNSIPFLHNGYFTILIKQGVLGVIIYLAFLGLNSLTAFGAILRKNSFENRLLLAVFLIILVTTYTTTGIFTLENGGFLCVFIGYLAKKEQVSIWKTSLT
ncbi:O-antigen ligase family protein [Enterococcus alishanensis]